MDEEDMFFKLEELEVNGLYYVSSPYANIAIFDGKSFNLPSWRLGSLVFKEDNYYGINGGRVKPLAYLGVNVGFGFKNNVVLDLINFINTHMDIELMEKLYIPSADEIVGD